MGRLEEDRVCHINNNTWEGRQARGRVGVQKWQVCGGARGSLLPVTMPPHYY